MSSGPGHPVAGGNLGSSGKGSDLDLAISETKLQPRKPPKVQYTPALRATGSGGLAGASGLLLQTQGIAGTAGGQQKSWALDGAGSCETLPLDGLPCGVASSAETSAAVFGVRQDSKMQGGWLELSIFVDRKPQNEPHLSHSASALLPRRELLAGMETSGELGDPDLSGVTRSRTAWNMALWALPAQPPRTPLLILSTSF